MNKNIHASFLSICLVIALFAIGLSGCVDKNTPTPETTPIPPTAEVIPTPTTVPARIILFDPSGLSGEPVNTLLTDFSASNTLTYEKWTAFDSNLTNVKVLVVFGGVDNLEGIASAAPETQFVVVTDTPPTISGNISVIQSSSVDLAFMAGFMSALTSEDWRMGGMVVDDGNLGTADAFKNGGRYLCGQCSPLYPPWYYPAVEALTSQSDPAAWTTQATTLFDAGPNSIFIDRAGDIPEVLDQFTGSILYGNNPASANLSRYAAILSADVLPGLQQLLPEVLAGQGGKTIHTRITLSVINDENIVSPGKQTSFNQVAQDLADGLINPLSVP